MTNVPKIDWSELPDYIKYVFTNEIGETWGLKSKPDKGEMNWYTVDGFAIRLPKYDITTDRYWTFALQLRPGIDYWQNEAQANAQHIERLGKELHKKHNRVIELSKENITLREHNEKLSRQLNRIAKCLED